MFAAQFGDVCGAMYPIQLPSCLLSLIHVWFAMICQAVCGWRSSAAPSQAHGIMQGALAVHTYGELPVLSEDC